MQLHIRFSGMLRVLAGTKEVFLDVEENRSLREALICTSTRSKTRIYRAGIKTAAGFTNNRSFNIVIKKPQTCPKPSRAG